MQSWNCLVATWCWRVWVSTSDNFQKGDLHRSKTFAIISLLRRGYSSAGRALAWHARGQRFDPAYLHQQKVLVVQGQYGQILSPSSRGLGHHPFTVSTGVRIPLGTPALSLYREVRFDNRSCIFPDTGFKVMP